MSSYKKSMIASGAVSLLFGAMMWAGCSSGPDAGTNGGPCLANMTCNAGLICANNVCAPDTDSGVMDSGMVDSGKKDTGKDTGNMDTSMGSMCPTPADVSNFMPGAVHDPVTPANVCANADVMQYYTDCFAMYDQMKCDGFIMNKKSCASCLETLDDKSATWGAVVDRTFYHFYLNISGCVKILGDSNCEKAIQDEWQCEEAACMAQCWTGTQMMQADIMNLGTCFNNAAMGGCKKYVDAINTTCNAADAGSAFGQCKALAGNSMQFQTGFTNYAAMFCQAGASDAGPPPDAGPPDAGPADASDDGG
jgi:hypothetical protein